MLSISLVILMVAASSTPAEPYSQLIRTSPDKLVLLHLAPESKVTLVGLDSNHRIERVTHALRLAKETLFRTRATPIGDKLLPAFSLLGMKGDDTLLLFRVADKNLVEVSLKTGAILAEKRMLFPANPKALFSTGDRFILMASLITQSHCNQIGDCEFFHLVNPNDWSTHSYFGQGKSFQDSFMKGDIPLAFWWPKRKIGGIFYSKSKDLYLYSKAGAEDVLATHFETSRPKGRSELIALDTLVLLIGTKEKVVGFRLEEHTWKSIGEWAGSWLAFSALKGNVLLVNKQGELMSRPLLR